MSETNNSTLLLANELLKVNLNADNLDENLIKKDEVLSDSLLKTESNVNNNEFVEVNNSTCNKTELNDDDKLTFHDAKEKLDDNDVNNETKFISNSLQTSNLNKEFIKEIEKNDSTVDDDTLNKDKNVNLELNECKLEAVEEITDKKIEKTISNESLNENSVIKIENDNNEKNELKNEQITSENDLNVKDINIEDKNLTQTEVLDDDEIKTNPAYIPKTGRFYMHDLRCSSDSGEVLKNNKSSSDTENGENNNNSTAFRVNTNNRIKISRADRKWEHDLFDYKQQIPRTKKQINRRYKTNIRLNSNFNKRINNNDIDSGEIVDDDDDDDDDDVDNDNNNNNNNNGNGHSSFEQRNRMHQRIRRQSFYQRNYSKTFVQNDKKQNYKLQNKINQNNLITNNVQRRRRRQLSNNNQNFTENREIGNKLIKSETKKAQTLTDRNGFKRTILPSRFHNLNNQIAPRRPFTVNNVNNNHINTEQNRKNFSSRQNNIRWRNNRRNNYCQNDNCQNDNCQDDNCQNFNQQSNNRRNNNRQNDNSQNDNNYQNQEQNNFKNLLPLTRQNFNHDVNRESVTTYGSGQRQRTQYKFNTNKNEHNTFRKNLNNNYKQNFQPQQRFNYNKNHFIQTSNFLNNKNSRNFKQNNNNNNNNQYFQPNQFYNQQISPKFPIVQQQQSYSNNNNNYSNNFPSLNESLNQQNSQISNININRNLITKQPQNYQNDQQQSLLRQPTDVVYFDPTQQVGHNSSIIQARERRRLKIAPPTQ